MLQQVGRGCKLTLMPAQHRVTFLATMVPLVHRQMPVLKRGWVELPMRPLRSKAQKKSVNVGLSPTSSGAQYPPANVDDWLEQIMARAAPRWCCQAMVLTQ
jgi:hypothetical protein